MRHDTKVSPLLPQRTVQGIRDNVVQIYPRHAIGMNASRTYFERYRRCSGSSILRRDRIVHDLSSIYRPLYLFLEVVHVVLDSPITSHPGISLISSGTKGVRCEFDNVPAATHRCW